MSMDMAMATRDATQTIPMGSPLPTGFWDQIVAQIQKLFAELEALLSSIEGGVNMRLSQFESGILSNPNLSAADRQRAMNRLDQSQAMVDQRFNQARASLTGADTSAIGALERQRAMHAGGQTIPTGMVDLGGGDMVPATMVTRDIFGRLITVHGRHGAPKHIPPGLAQRFPPGIPPGQVGRRIIPGPPNLYPNPGMLRFNR